MSSSYLNLSPTSPRLNLKAQPPPRSPSKPPGSVATPSRRMNSDTTTLPSSSSLFGIESDYLRMGICWTDHVLPSGSLKQMNDPQGCTSTSLVSTPRSVKTFLTASTSSTTT